MRVESFPLWRNEKFLQKNIDLCIQSLVKMNHRAGFINGEGDGIGIHIDVPKSLWNEKLKSSGYNPTIVDHPHFIVGHFFLNKNENIVNLKIIFVHN